MVVSIISLVFSVLSFCVSGFCVYKIYKTNTLIKEEDITIEKDDNVFINNQKF